MCQAHPGTLWNCLEICGAELNLYHEYLYINPGKIVDRQLIVFLSSPPSLYTVKPLCLEDQGVLVFVELCGCLKFQSSLSQSDL